MFSKKRILSFVLCLSFIFAGGISALSAQTESSAQQDDSTWYYNKLIKSVTFKNLKNVDHKDIDGVTGSFIGRRFTDELYEQMIDRIYALDLFDDISTEAVPGDENRATVSIVFTVVERPIISRIIFSGNKQIRTAELKDSISIKEKDIFVEDKIAVDERTVRGVYLSKGYTNINVSSTTREGPRGIEVVFIIDEGRPTVISSIKFRGNRVFSERTLKGKISLKEVGLINKGAFQESALEADRQAILSYYRENGYIDAVVLDVTKETSVNEEKNRDELTITFVIQEGSQYTFGGIDFNGNIIFSDERLSSLVTLKTGAVFNQLKYEESIMAVADLYYENGYTANRFQPIPHKDVDNHVVSYTLQIGESVRSHVESIVVRGNTKTKDEIILREIPLQSGDIFSKAKITNGLRNLYNLQYFSAVVPDIVGGSEENLVNLIINVDEQSTTSIEFGVTFSGVTDTDELPFALFVKWQDSNFRGEGRSISAGTTIATDEQSVTFSYGENWLFGLPISTSVSTSFSHSSVSTLRYKDMPDGTIDEDNYYMDYDEWRWSLGLSLGHRWTPDWAILTLNGGITGSLINNEYDDSLYVPVDSTVLEYANTWGWQNSIWASFSVDDRDISYDPSKGWFASQRFAWYGLTPLEVEFFLRSDTKAEKYFTLIDLPITETWNLKAVLSMYSGLSMLFPAPNTGIGNSSKLYIDGMFNGRGWTDIYNTFNGRSSRGKAMWSSNVELRLPVVPGIIAFDVFADAVVIKDSAEALFTALNPQDFFFSVGPGIRFSIPQFPLRLLFANTFKITENNSVEWYDKWKFCLSFNLTNR